MSTPTKTPTRLVVPKSKKKPPYDYYDQHYRDPGEGADPVKRWLPHPDNARAICWVLRANGIREQDLQDAMQDVLVRVLAAFGKGIAHVPADLRQMKAFCASVARRHAMATLRKAARRERLGDAGPCEVDPDEHTPLEHLAPVHRDPVDAGRQLEILAQLFREGRMPEHGVDVLEGVASRCTYEEIAAELEISDELARWRMREMHRIYRKRMAELGMLPGMKPLRLVVSQPSAIALLRQAA